MYKIAHPFVCTICGKKKKSVNKFATICRECKKWNKPGKNQLKLI